jgi:hypothetical protein
MEVAGSTGLIALGEAGGVHLSTDMDCFLILLRRNSLALAFFASTESAFSLVKWARMDKGYAASEASALALRDDCSQNFWVEVFSTSAGR